MKNLTSNDFMRYAILLFLGMANSLPIPLAGTVLSIWLSELGFEKATIGFFALMGLPFCFKILWSPIIDHVPLPLFHNSPRKGWLAFSLGGISLSLAALGVIEPAQAPWMLAICLLALSTFTGCLYISGLAYELESLDESQYSTGSACVTTGYRIGLLCAGGGGLFLAYLWGWSWMFLTMAGAITVGCVLILLYPEPYKSQANLQTKREEFATHASLFKGFWQETLMQPCCRFLQHPQWLKIIMIIVAFKCGDQLSKSMEGPFYLSLGFNKADLALAAKMWGFIFTILGAFFSGIFIKNRDPFKAVGIVGCFHAATLFCNYALTFVGKSYEALYATVAAENLTGGMAMTAFIYMLWKVCDKRYAAVQYALLWSVFSFKGDILACAGGVIAAATSWNTFFFLVAFCGLLSSLAVLWASQEKGARKALNCNSPGHRPG